MFNIKNYEYDCTKKCKSLEHANQINGALTKRSISDELLAAFIAKTCANFYNVTDETGRSAVHMSASVGRYVILEWLLNQGAIINNLDLESGSSPLHHALFYGNIDCSVLLMKWGASLDLQDFDTCWPFKNIFRVSDIKRNEEIPSLNEILVWGSNKNYNLGSTSDEVTTIPQHIDYFRKEHISLEEVALGTYHSLFLSKKGHLYSVGHGKGGRLGSGNELILPAPQKVKIPIKNDNDSIKCISVSSKHSLVLTNRSLVFATGLNEDQQLGVRDCGEKLSVFKEVVTLRDFGVENLNKVIARDQYSLTYNCHTIYVWGTHLGQFGLDSNTKTLNLPTKMKLPPNTSIDFVEASNTAIVVACRKLYSILLYYNYKMKTIKTPVADSLKSISLFGGDLNKTAKGSATALKLLMLTRTNEVFIWHEMTQTFLRTSFNNIRLTDTIDKILYKANQVLILSNGDVYKGKCKQIPLPNFDTAPAVDKKKNNENPSLFLWTNQTKNHKEISEEHLIRIDLERITNIDRALDIFANEDFSSFAVLQESSLKYFKFPSFKAQEYCFKKLFLEVSTADSIHDIVFHIDQQSFPAHKFIVFSRAPGLEALISSPDKDVHLNEPGLSGKMFEFILKFIYTNYLPNQEDLEIMKQSLDSFSGDLKDVCQLFSSFVGKFQMNSLNHYLKKNLEKENFFLPHRPEKSKYIFHRLKRINRPELHDVQIVCSGDLNFQAHKCILVDRSEFFERMFSHNWSEQSSITFDNIPIEYMKTIIDFLYSDDIDSIRKENYSETYLYNMIIYCDQYFIERLRKICELLILDKITIRKCGDMLDFANMYNCSALKNGCEEFICQNLQRVLTYRSLENCDPESLAGLNSHYRNIFKEAFAYRVIVPHSDVIEDEVLESYVADFEIDLNYQLQDDEDDQRKGMDSSKVKFKESKAKQDLKHYEREAIISMKEKLSLNEKTPSHEDAKPLRNVSENLEKSPEESNQNWMKVIDKKEQKKRISLENALKASAIIQQEDKPKLEFIPLKVNKEETNHHQQQQASCSPLREDPVPISSTPNKSYNLNLSDFTPNREKLSQKQRKRLSSSSSNNNSNSWRSPALETSTNSLSSPPIPIPNAWNIKPQEPTSPLFEDFDIPTGSSLDPTSYGNVARSSMKNNKPTKNSTSPATVTGKSFSQILDEEKKERDYFERLRTKSLALTQIEETAIAELREFYNADNSTDELITIERVRRPQTMNFAVWPKN